MWNHWPTRLPEATTIGRTRGVNDCDDEAAAANDLAGVALDHVEPELVTRTRRRGRQHSDRRRLRIGGARS
jgi:hypothetical protein